MFTYFHQHKFLCNEKGQMLPFFLFFLVVLLTMALVTVNLSKVASLKTESSNAVDAGALASGSLMANLFNTIADRNKLMADTYWQFYAGISAEFTLALATLIMAHTSAIGTNAIATSAAIIACPVPCLAATFVTSVLKIIAATTIPATEMFIKTAGAIMLSVGSFAVSQYFFYLQIRNMAEDGREQGIRLGHQLAFSNSDIPAKLKFGSPPAEVTEERERRNYSLEYNKFTSDLDDASEYTYDWQDGQKREHSVKVRVEIDAVKDYALRVSAFPLPIELGILGFILFQGHAANESLIAAEASYTDALGSLIMACAFSKCCNAFNPYCCAAWLGTCADAKKALEVGIAATTSAKTAMISIYPSISFAWSGLLPGPVIKSTNSLDAAPFIIAWIEDVEHNRRVRVDTWQTHQGQDLGQWQTDYPDLHSFSVIDFTGGGKIHPPALEFDSSIIATDLPLGKTVDDHFQTCPLLQKQIEAWEKEIASLDKASQDNQTEADKLDLEAQRLRQVGLPDEAAQLEEMANEMRLRAQDLSQQANDLEAKIEQTKQDNPDCFSELTG